MRRPPKGGGEGAPPNTEAGFLSEYGGSVKFQEVAVTGPATCRTPPALKAGYTFTSTSGKQSLRCTRTKTTGLVTVTVATSAGAQDFVLTDDLEPLAEARVVAKLKASEAALRKALADENAKLRKDLAALRAELLKATASAADEARKSKEAAEAAVQARVAPLEARVAPLETKATETASLVADMRGELCDGQGGTKCCGCGCPNIDCGGGGA